MQRLNERGSIPLYMMLFLFFLVFSVLSFDLTRAMAVRARLKTATDAAALAAAMTATKVADTWETVDALGNPTNDQTKIAGVKNKHWHMEIKDQTAALQAADDAFGKNGFSVSHNSVGPLSKVVTDVTRGTIYTSTSAQSATPAYQNDSYQYYAKVLVRPVFLNGAIASQLPGISVQAPDPNNPGNTVNYIPVSATGTGSASLP